MPPPIRTEEVFIELELDSEYAKNHRLAVATLLEGKTPPVFPGDSLKVGYRFWIEYFGDTVRKLEALNELMADPGVVCRGSLEEIVQGRSVIVDVLSQLDKLIKTEAAR